MLSLLPLLITIACALPTVTVGDAALKPYQLRGVQSPIFHLYLQSFPTANSTPVMGPEATSEYFTIGSSIQSLNSSLFLNIGPGTGKSYLPLSLDTVPTTTAWGLEGDTVITTAASSYGRQLNFLACNSATTGYYTLYLQKGSDTPSGQNCSNYQTIHTPCLC
ncbi:hypothetical protein BGZ57DRAFT_771905 [Hyaloscypha finlandica]|nr:hypothetical protein BGZ57DRAFT_771905 [Hyaloscypha finlandica]KAH8768665.1 hypothetical protein F5882DRAFT_302241 [Hyaloscypha sp. PMI_1271]